MDRSSVWAPVVSSAISAVAVLLAVFFTQRSTTKREREARRTDFQIKSLSELQQAMYQLEKATYDLLLHAEAILRGDPGSGEPEKAMDHFLDARSRALMLQAMVKNDRVRQ